VEYHQLGILMIQGFLITGVFLLGNYGLKQWLELCQSQDKKL